MNARIRELLGQYDRTLAAFTLQRVEDITDNDSGSLGHLRYMIARLLEEGDEWSERKVNRWLGFIQGTLWATGVVGIRKLRDQDRFLYDD